MERDGSKRSFALWVLVASLVLSDVVAPVMCTRTRSLQGVEDQKAYGPPRSPGSRASSPKTDCPTPSSGGTPANHGGGASGSSPTPVTVPSPVTTPSTPVYTPTPVTTPSTPVTTPTTPVYTPTPVTTPTTPVYTPTPGTTPTTTPIIFPPGTPLTSPITGTYDFWRTHPTLIWGILGCWGNLANLFGLPTTTIFGLSNPTFPQALANTRNDAYGSLMREGAASYLNSMANRQFPFSTQQVREYFAAGLVSEKAAADQGHRFRLANEGRTK